MVTSTELDNLIKRKIRELNTVRSTLMGSVAALNKEKVSKEAVLKRIESQITELNKRTRELKSKRAKITRDKNSIKAKENALSAKRSKLFTQLRQMVQAKNRVKRDLSLFADVKKFDKTISVVNERLAELNSRIAVFNKSYNEAHAKELALAAQENRLTRSINSRQANADSKKREIRNILQRIVDLEDRTYKKLVGIKCHV